MKKIPLRTCVITKEKLEKKDLIRIVRTPDNEIIIDKTGKANGRGAYLKKNMHTIDIAQKTNELNKHLKIDVPDSIYEELRRLVSE